MLVVPEDGAVTQSDGCLYRGFGLGVRTGTRYGRKAVDFLPSGWELVATWQIGGSVKGKAIGLPVAAVMSLE